MVAPLRETPPWVQWMLAVACIALCCGLTVRLRYLGHGRGLDGRWYVRIAEGDSAHTMQPFVSRQLGAQVAGALARAFHTGVVPEFFVQAIVAMVLTLGLVYWLAMRSWAPRWLLVAIAVAPFWAQQMEYFTLPDAWYALLLAALMGLLWMEWFGAAAAMIFPLMLSRESTALVVVCLLVAGWSRLRWRERVGAVLAAAAGSWVVGRLAAGSLGNKEKLPEWAYLLLKMPWNLLRNVAGVQPWSNVYTEICAVPRWQMGVHLGSVRAVGVCGYSSAGLVEWATAAVLNFGLLPVLVGWLWWRGRRWRGETVVLRFALLYGALSFALAPALGTWVLRLAGYGWPLFFVALPMLFEDAPVEGRRAWAAAGFFAAHVLASVLGNWFIFGWYLPVEAVLWGVGWWLARVWLGERQRLPLNA